eukprot:TRINITY_DN1003_c0_g1_i2.p1 TRINITY_DN1003_c0_g1~~TRINITY_DN1003_c0_g1_i2.p1  ORF type:complete len:282 (-),score=40.26 TRINITY_DN1003_c0_g1_i2:90-935(-)
MKKKSDSIDKYIKKPAARKPQAESSSDDDNDGVVMANHARVGNRKYRRWMNSVAAGCIALNQHQQELYLTDEDIEEEVNKPPFEFKNVFLSIGYSFFDEKLVDADNKYEDEDKFDEKEPMKRIPTTSPAMFACIDRRIRLLFKRLHDLGFLQRLESFLMNFKYDELGPGMDFAEFTVFHPSEFGIDVSRLPTYSHPIILHFDDPFQRMLAHGLCQFHQLTSHSCNVGDRRITVIKRNREFAHPAVEAGAASVHSLVDYLRELKENKAAPVHHITIEGKCQA